MGVVLRFVSLEPGEDSPFFDRGTVNLALQSDGRLVAAETTGIRHLSHERVRNQRAGELDS